jgi:cation transport ATPase
MNIFNNLKIYDKDKAHQEYLQKKGISEEEYLQRLEQNRKDAHQKELNAFGITEEEFQRREKKSERKRMIKESLDKYGTIAFLLCGMALFVFGIVSQDFREAVKPVILSAGGIWLLFILVMICTPVYLIVNNFIQQTKWNKYLKVTVSLILTLIVLAMFGLLFHTCNSGGGSDYYEPGKMRPDKF